MPAAAGGRGGRLHAGVFAIVRRGAEALVRLFYRTVAVSGRDRVPADGPVLLVANHPNGLADPVILRIALGQPIAFLAKSTFFDLAVARLAMDAFGAIAIHRPRDGARTGDNEETFARCRERLADRGWIAVFPEGTTHSEPRLKPLKTGAARIALGALAESPATRLAVLPVGLLYEDKERFRSRVAVSVGEPLDLSRHVADYRREPRDTVERVTAEIEEALRRVTLEAETRELWQGFVAVAAWTSREATGDLAVHETRARELAQAWRRLASSDPERAAAMVGFVRRFVRMLRAVGIRNPLGLELAETPRPVAIARSLLPAALLSPLAVVGLALGWLPYRLVKPLAHAMVRDNPALIATTKGLLGVVIMTVAWVTEAIVAGVFLGRWVGLAVLIIGPLTGGVALSLGESLALRRQALRAYWIRARRAAIAREIATRRRELAELVEAELGLDRTARA